MDSDPVEIRGDIARRVADSYRANPHVAAVLVAGSVARGLADDLSDIELDVYWSRSPTSDLCERHLPQADVATLRRDFDHRRIGPTPTV